MKSKGSKSVTSPAIRLLKLLASKSVIGPIPLLASRSDFQKASSPMPFGATMPMPVTTTRFRLFITGPEGVSEASSHHSRHYIKCSHYVSNSPLTAVYSPNFPVIHKFDLVYL